MAVQKANRTLDSGNTARFKSEVGKYLPPESKLAAKEDSIWGFVFFIDERGNCWMLVDAHNWEPKRKNLKDPTNGIHNIHLHEAPLNLHAFIGEHFQRKTPEVKRLVAN